MFIVTNFGTPGVEATLTPCRPNRLAAMAQTWKRCKAFDGVSRFELVPESVPRFTWFQRMLAHTVYNPPSGMSVGWQRTGGCRLEDIIAEVEKGLENDDDIIQQWFGADDVLKLLRSATTFAEMIDRVRCVCGEFEGDERLREVVASVLGKDWHGED